MNTELNTKTLRVNITTAKRLDTLKGKGISYDNIIDKMLSYFENIGIDIKQTKITPIDILVKEQATRIIEIVRGIEKTQRQYFLNIMNNNINQNVQNTGANEEEMIEYSSVKDMFDNYQILDKKCKDLQQENKDLKAQVQQQIQNSSDSDVKDYKKIKDDMLDVILELDKRHIKNPMGNSNNFEIRRTDYEAWSKALKNLVNKI